MKDSKRLQDRVYAAWIARPDRLRTASSTESFIDDMWESGLRLSGSTATHYQMAMNTIRHAVLANEHPV